MLKQPIIMRDRGIPGENKGREEKVGNGICKKPKYQKFEGDIHPFHKWLLI